MKPFIIEELFFSLALSALEIEGIITTNSSDVIIDIRRSHLSFTLLDISSSVNREGQAILH